MFVVVLQHEYDGVCVTLYLPIWQASSTS